LAASADRITRKATIRSKCNARRRGNNTAQLFNAGEPRHGDDHFHKNSVRARRRHSRRPAAARANPVAQLREKLGLNRKTFSRLTGFSERAITNWESGGKPEEPGLRRIRETERLQRKLAEVVEANAIPGWLDAPNEAFGGLKPLEVIERCEVDRLWSMIFYLESGVAA
jgi:DNA-binding transcriptional regulator YiaG